MDEDWFVDTPATPCEQCVGRALELILLSDVDDFIEWAESSDYARRCIINSDPQMHFEPWTKAIVRAQHLCRAIEVRLAAEAAIKECAQ